ncbi:MULTISPECIES: NleF caspase inhibitor [Yersinia pseudotuberculosis complex]|uniref:Uncharacterized protein n=1 Tax=Yersinia pseudotuberculosis serotype O:1b (strain IP 31758) TaxID=349747 RepID=A0A0U1R1V9_YERP3|nr:MULTISPECIES: NleF caspase inhibitor [Yersinia pseudotuberculosis complex]ABS49213.1 hypothetical protein YpsIP31758_1505 [Yersinia pseudotuberculosis IP 31758]AJK14659.1 hypothetical protein BZ19_1902 [Yersinia pseudotuberculosis str. PA3606]MCE4111186.1 hypothetical protein [Yersinia pseudotuberculosis]MCF1162584.1 hypothetical protein [Yersinia pseudotuberculosis]RYC25583.1 hypothetical protein EU971_13810 [Yersinia pseudotuberculosis]
MPACISADFSPTYSCSNIEDVKDTPCKTLSDSDINQCRLTSEQESKLNEIKSIIQYAHQKGVNTTSIKESLKELKSEFRQLIEISAELREKIYEVMIHKKTGAEMLEFRLGYDKSDRDNYINGLIYLYKIHQCVSDSIEDAPKNYKELLKKIIDTKDKSPVHGDIKSLSEGHEVPTLKYNNAKNSKSGCSCEDIGEGCCKIGGPVTGIIASILGCVVLFI